jgi:hypothetical protein
MMVEQHGISSKARVFLQLLRKRAREVASQSVILSGSIFTDHARITALRWFRLWKM